jgi:hypothetical protein
MYTALTSPPMVHKHMFTIASVPVVVMLLIGVITTIFAFAFLVNEQEPQAQKYGKVMIPYIYKQPKQTCQEKIVLIGRSAIPQQWCEEK